MAPKLVCVMVVSRHMPGIGLSWGHRALVAPEADDAHESAWQKHKHTETHRGVPRFRALVRR